MSASPAPAFPPGRAEELFRADRADVHRRTDQLFAWLLAGEWLAAVAVALWITPLTWAGAVASTHVHVWAALLLGGASVMPPVFLAWSRPGAAATRHAIAAGQMLVGALLIHLSGGRIETHFHVFGSLAFLAFYRDWRVLGTASAVVAADHLVRGMYFPRSVFGALDAGSWRWLEHTGWVVFEDLFLIASCRRGVREMRANAERQAELESAHADEERIVAERTKEARALAIDLAAVNREQLETLGALRASEERFGMAARGTADGIWDWNVHNNNVYFAPRFKELLGRADHEMENRFESWSELLHPDDRGGTLAALQAHVERRLPYDVEYRLRHVSGRWRWFRARGQAIWDADGKAERMAGSIQDVTDRKEAEQRLSMQYAVVRTLAESESLDAAMPQILQTVCQSLDWELGAYWRKEPDARRLRCLELWRAPECAVADYEADTRASLFPPGVGLPGWVWSAREPDWNPDAAVDGGVPRAPAAAHGGAPGWFVFPLECDDEIIGVVEFFSGKVRQPDRDLLPILGVLGSQFVQFLARRRAEQEVRQSAGELARANADLEQAVGAAVAANEELRQAQSQLVQSEKLAGLGQLVAGVAHEINNPLAFVTNNVAVLEGLSRDVAAVLEGYRQGDATLAAQRPELAAALAEKAAEVDLEYALANAADFFVRTRDGLKRIQRIVKDLREFARLDRSERDLANVNDGIGSTVNIVRGLARSRSVEIELDLAPLPAVPCVPAKLNQVVMNLVVNGIDACREGGRVAVRTRAVPDGVAIVVEDNGCGIAPALRDKIFDPFFTTKPVGQGTGLGLSISYGIVRDHAGRLEVASEPGKGATFTVFLPAAPAALPP